MTFDARGISHRWVVLIGLFFFMAINFADKALMGLAAEPIMRDLHLTHAEFGRIAASFFILFSVSSLLVSLLADRIRTRWLLFAMAVVWSLSQVPLLLYTMPATLVASRVLLGASEGPAFPVALHSLYKWFPDRERAVPSALMTLGSAFGLGIVAPGITAIIVTFGWHSAVSMLAIIGLVWSVIWLWIGKEGPLDAPGHGAAAPQPGAAAGSSGKLPLRMLLLARTSIGSNLNGFAAYALLTMSTIWLPSYLVRVAGYSMTQVGWIVVVPAFAQMIAAPLLGWWSQRLMARGVRSRHARGTLGSLMVVASGAALVLMSTLSAGPLLIASLTVAFSLAAFTFTAGPLLAGEIAPPAQRGGLLGITVCVSTLAGFATPAVMGHVIDHAANPLAGYRMGMMLAGAFAVVAGLLGAYLIDPAFDLRRFAAYVAARNDQRGPCVPLPSGKH
jgi:MFS family permease